MKFIKIIKKPLFYIPVIIFVLLVAGGAFFFSPKQDKFEVTVLAPQALTQEVSVTGKVVAKNDVKLGFENSGRIVAVYKEVGSAVLAGEAIAVLDSSEIRARLLQAEADEEREQAKFDELKRGTRPEQIAIAEVKVGNAKVALLDTKQNVVDKISDAFVKSDDAVRNKVDQFISNPRGSDPRLQFSGDQQLVLEIESTRRTLETVLNSWSLAVEVLAASSNLSEAILLAEKNLSAILAFLEKISLAVNSLNSTASASATTVDGYKTDVLTARTNLTSAVSAVSAAKEKLRSAESNLSLEENNLKLALAGSTQGDLAIQEASLKSATANVLNLQSQLAKTVIRAPFTGTISSQDAKVGEIATAGKTLVSLLGTRLHIETYVPEADIAKIKIKNQARVTLDAYGSSVDFPAEVVFIDPAETVVESVSTYRSLLEFKNEDSRIRSGMTANLDIVTATKENVLAVPQRAIAGQNGGSFVKVLVDGKVVEKNIQLGIRGTDGRVEVVSGLEVGDRVIIN